MTPSGELALAMVFSTPEAKVDLVKRSHSVASRLAIFSVESGVTTFGVLRKV